MAWRCRFLAARPSQDGRVIADAPDALVDFHTGESLECVELIVAAGADLDYMNDRKVFTGLAKMTALQRAEDIGAKQIRDFRKSKGAAAVSLRFGSRRRRRCFTHRRQEGDEGEAAERRLSSKYPPVCTQSS